MNRYMKPNKLSEKVSTSAFIKLEDQLDALFADLGIDIRITQHFMDRVNERFPGGSDAFYTDMLGLFKRLKERYGDKFKALDPKRKLDIVITSFRSKFNIPTEFTYDRYDKVFDAALKTFIYGDDFTGKDRAAMGQQKLKVEVANALRESILKYSRK